MRTYVTASGSTYTFVNGRLTRKSADWKANFNEFDPPITNAVSRITGTVAIGVPLRISVVGYGTLLTTPVSEIH